MKEKYFPDLYYETSTNGNGVHGYLVIDKRLWNEADYNSVLKDVEKWLKRVLASGNFDVETVELKGRCPSVVWGKDWKRQVSRFTMGGLAKMPRDWTRYHEWRATTKLTAHDLRKLPELYPVVDTPEIEVHARKQEAATSVRGQFIDKGKFEKYLPLARSFVPAPELVSAGSRIRVTAEDVAIFLVLLEFFSDNSNPDGSMPSKRFAEMWQRLYVDGEVSRSFDNKRFSWIRNRVSDRGGIEWTDPTYGEGKAAKWKASSQLRVLMYQYNNSQHKLYGSKAPELDAIWVGMPSENVRNVGLRPVRSVVHIEKWTLANHLDGLEALGIEWMAA